MPGVVLRFVRIEDVVLAAEGDTDRSWCEDRPRHPHDAPAGDSTDWTTTESSRTGGEMKTDICLRQPPWLMSGRLRRTSVFDSLDRKELDE